MALLTLVRPSPGSETPKVSAKNFLRSHGFITVRVALEDTQDETGLSDAQMLHAVGLWQLSVLRRLSGNPAGPQEVP